MNAATHHLPTGINGRTPHGSIARDTDSRGATATPCPVSYTHLTLPTKA